MLPRSLVLAAAAALLLAACSRQTEVVLEVDLLSFAADDRVSVLSLTSLAETDELYIGGDGDGSEPDGGLLVDLGDDLGDALGEALTSFSLRVGFQVAPTAPVERVRFALYLGDADDEADSADVYRDANLWGEAEVTNVPAGGQATATLALAAAAGDVAASLLFDGRFRLGLLVSAESDAAAAGDEVTLTWTEGVVTLGTVPGGLLP